MTGPRQIQRFRPGDVLAGRYRVQRLLGEGARKQVHAARDEWLEREVAVCALVVATPEETARLRREAALLARLGEHPSIVSVHDVLEVDGTPVMICQYLPGGSVQDLLREGPLDVVQAVGIGRDVAAALVRTHAEGIVHRDLKPANIWLDEQGHAVVGDLGLAIGAGVDADPFDLLVGTAAYMAPEQLVADACDARCDLYSLGAVLYALLTGRPPFVEASLLGVVSQSLHEQPDPPSKHRPDIPPALEDLVLRLLAKDPAQRPASAADVLAALTPQLQRAARSGAAAATGFVGRPAELTELHSALDQAALGRGGVTLVLGEPGVGKTRIALELAHEAAANGWAVLTGRCHDGAAPAFWPWTQVIRAALRELGDDVVLLATDADLLSAIVPELALVVHKPSERDESRFPLFETVSRLLKRLSEKAPVAVMIDDVHWADPASVALLTFLARELEGARVTVLACARDVATTDDAAANAAVSSLAAAATRTVPLGGLTLAETADFLAGSHDLHPEPRFLQELHDRTEGNPFYLSELVRLLTAEQRITSDGALLPGGQLVPTSVREVLHLRLRHVSPACADLLRVFSVAGREVVVPLLCRVAGRQPDEVLGLLDEAIAARLVVQPHGTPARYRFAHALIREALYDELPSLTRAKAHRGTAAALEEAHGEPHAQAAELAHHYVRAAVDGDAAPAVQWSVRAAAAAQAAAAYEDAVLHYARALQLVEAMPGYEPSDDLPAHGELLLLLGNAQERSGQTEPARHTFMRAADEGLLADDAALLARAALGYGIGLGGFGFVEHADGVLLSLLEEALVCLGAQDNPLRMRVLARLATELYFTPFRSRRLQLSEQAVEMAHRLGDPEGELIAVYSRTLALLGPGGVEERRRTADRVVWLGTTVSDVDMTFRGHHLRLMVALEVGSLEQAHAEVAACRRIADAHRRPVHQWHAEVFEAMLALATGRFEEGLRGAQRGLQIGRRGHAEMAQVMNGAQLLAVHWAQGRLEEVLDGVRAFADAYPHAPAWRAAYAFCCTEVGQLQEAQVQLDLLAQREFADLPEDGNYLLAAALLAHVAARLADVPRARLLEAKLAPYADQYVVIAAGAAAFTSARHALGVVRAACGDVDGALLELNRAHSLHEHRGTPPYAVWTAEDQARLLLARGLDGDAAAAGELVRTWLPAARSMDMAAHVRRLEALVDELRLLGVFTDGGEWTGPDTDSVTVLLSDVAGSTKLTEQLGERAMHALLFDHRRTVEDAARRHGGLVLKALGDAVLAALPSAEAGLRCAAEVQRRYEGTSSPVRVRIGVHTGAVLRQGSSMYGRTMILAFRVADRARAGEVLVSAAAKQSVGAGWDFGGRRLLRLKGITEPQEVHRLDWQAAASGA